MTYKDKVLMKVLICLFFSQLFQLGAAFKLGHFVKTAKAAPLHNWRFSTLRYLLFYALNAFHNKRPSFTQLTYSH